MVEHVFRFLDVKSLCRASSVCRLFAAARWHTADLSSYAAKVDQKVLLYVLSKQPRRLIMPCAAIGPQAGPLLPDAFCGVVLNLRGLQLARAGLLYLNNRDYYAVRGLTFRMDP